MKGTGTRMTGRARWRRSSTCPTSCRREYYHPNDRGYEHEINPRLERIRKILHEEDDNGDGRSGQRNA